MWWEILPSAGIVFGALLAPHGAYWVLNKLSHNGKVRRSLYLCPRTGLKIQMSRSLDLDSRSKPLVHRGKAGVPNSVR